jgi:hypothetical protein
MMNDMGTLRKNNMVVLCIITFFISLDICIFMMPSSIASDNSGMNSSNKNMHSVWKAVTEFGGFDLEISPDFSRVMYLGLHLEKFECGGITITGDINAESRNIWPIVNNQFDINTNLGIYQIIICGVFDVSRKRLCGTWEIHSGGTTCSGMWEAQ